MAQGQLTEDQKLTRDQVYYARHREEKREKVRERYHNRPDVMEKRAERERIRVEKAKAEVEAKRAKQIEREKKTEERNQQRLALIARKEQQKTRSKKSTDPSPESVEVS